MQSSSWCSARETPSGFEPSRKVWKVKRWHAARVPLPRQSSRGWPAVAGRHPSTSTSEVECCASASHEMMTVFEMLKWKVQLRQSSAGLLSGEGEGAITLFRCTDD